MKLAPPLLATVFALLALTACGTIMQGSTQQLSISSSPSSAAVTIDGMERGTTPIVADLTRKDTHTIHIEAEGYQPYELAVSRSVSGWVAGNIVFGGIIGLAVDAITGGMYKLTPDQVQATLDGSEVAVTDDGLFAMVVLSPSPDWEMIDRLEVVR